MSLDTVYKEVSVGVRPGTLVVAVALGLVFVLGQLAASIQPPQPRPVYRLLGCLPDKGTCHVFNAWTGEVDLVPFPSLNGSIVPLSQDQES